MVLCIEMTNAVLKVPSDCQIIQCRYYKLLPVIGRSGVLFSDALSNCQFQMTQYKYGALVESYGQGQTEVYGDTPVTESVVDHKSHTNYPANEEGPPR
jgi:hypothetical protein